MCGEMRFHYLLVVCSGGSPPHVRGKESSGVKTEQKNRITPACAGKSLGIFACFPLEQDHPRMCGEKYEDLMYDPRVMGSPPHVRGKDLGRCAPVNAGGITPACAGKSLEPVDVSAIAGDHPRMCGEKSISTISTVQTGGSPPHVRGKGSKRSRIGRKRRITPACAGKRLKRSRSTVSHAAIVPLFPSVCNKPAGSDGSPAGHDAPPFLPIENAAPASPAYNLRSL